MTNTMLRIIGVLFLLTASSAFAQEMVVADVPFDFIVGSKVLPAGEYNITRNVTSPNALILTNQAKKGGAITFATLVHTNSQAQQPKLVFHRYGRSIYLAEVWSTSDGRRLRPSRGEKEALARLGTPTSVRVVAKKR